MIVLLLSKKKKNFKNTKKQKKKTFLYIITFVFLSEIVTKDLIFNRKEALVSILGTTAG